jgi:hypothetical protein
VLLILGVKSQQSHQECDSESVVKVSQLFGLHHQLLRKQDNIPVLESEIEKLENVFEHELYYLHDLLNGTIEGTETIEREIENMSTPHIEELQFSCDRNIPRDCCEIKKMLPSAKSGLYTIRDPCLIGDKLFRVSRLTVYCDMEMDGGGWIVIQRRNTSMGWVHFNRTWAEYERGFGDLDGEFWIGLKNIYELTNQQNMEMKISVWNDTSTSINWKYPFFRISDRSNWYALSGVSTGSRDGSYSAFGHETESTNYFHTYDRNRIQNCDYRRGRAGWWYYSVNCNYANLNGRHQPTGFPSVHPVREGLTWRTFPSGWAIYTHSKMMIRPTNCGLS